jgi:PAS domain S-box-containing protein
MTWQSTFLPLLYLINTGIALIIMQAAWQRRHTRGARPFFWMVLAVAIWLFTAAMELIVPGISQKIFWSKLQYFGITALPALWFMFALEYSQVGEQPQRIRQPYLALLWTIPVITLILALTNEMHGLIWSEITPIQGTTSTFFLYEHGVWFWIFAVYSYTTLLTGTLLLIFGAARFPSEYHRQTIMLLIGAAIPWIANIAYLSGATAWVGVDLTPIAFCLTGVIYAYQVFRFQLFDLVPIAQNSIVENMEEGIVVLDAQERVIYINPAAQKLLRAGNVIGRPAKDTLAALSTLISDDPTDTRRVLELPNEDLAVRFVDYHAQVLHNHRGNRNGQIIVLRDITERKKEEERLRLLIDTVPDGIIVVDQHGSITMANQRVEQMLGYSPSELNSQSFKIIIPEFYAGSSEMMSAYFQNPTGLENVHGYEVFVVCKNGSNLPVQIQLKQSVTPDGPMILATLRDLSQQKATEEQLNQQSVALASAASAILITNREGRITWVNPSFTLVSGFSAEEAIGNKPSLLKSGLHDEKFYADLWQTILAGNNWHGEVTNRHKDGSLFTEEATIAPVRNNQGDITHFIAIKQDVTKRKELERMRDELLQTIVHDLRNPLTSILFALDMIKDLPETMRLPPEMATMLAISRDNSWRMLGMVNAMLDYSKLEGGKMPLQREPVTLAELVEQSFRFQSQLAGRRELLLLNDVPYDLPVLSADRTLLSRVLQNLIDNAIKYAPQGSNIVIRAGLNPSRDAIIVRVHDDGPGIPSELESELFQKFASAASARGGTGLGLAFCRLAIEAHKGVIWVESGEEGQGTTFLFTLPIDRPNETKRSQAR